MIAKLNLGKDDVASAFEVELPLWDVTYPPPPTHPTPHVIPVFKVTQCFD